MLTLFSVPRSRDHFQVVRNSFYIIALGFALLTISKVSLFMKGIWHSWGPSRMTKPFKILYVLGYILMGFGIIQILVASL
jgi:hypothetical protein